MIPEKEKMVRVRPHTCCFTGHREIYDEDRETLRRAVGREIEALIQKGYTSFINGGAVGFDLIAAGEVLRLKARYPKISLLLSIPSKEHEDTRYGTWQEDYNKAKAAATKVEYASELYRPGCEHERNRKMVDWSSAIIVYCRKKSGGSFYTLNYAKEKGLQIIMIDISPKKRLSGAQK